MEGKTSELGFLRWSGRFSDARRDLEEAEEIARRGDMKLHLTDVHLEMCWLEREEKNPEEAKKHWMEAERLINETGYHRRDKELEEREKK